MSLRLKNYLENRLDSITKDEIDYHTFGKLAIWKILDELIKNEATIKSSPDLLCVVISAMAKIAIKNSQFRPQIVDLFLAGKTATRDEILVNRLEENIHILSSYQVSRKLL